MSDQLFEIIDANDMEPTVDCLVCHHFLYLACEYQPYESDTGVGEAYICGLNITKTQECTCNHSIEVLDQLFARVERSLMEAEDDGY